MAVLSCEMLGLPCPACAWVGISCSGTTGSFVPEGATHQCSERSPVPLGGPVHVTRVPQGWSLLGSLARSWSCLPAVVSTAGELAAPERLHQLGERGV